MGPVDWLRSRFGTVRRLKAENARLTERVAELEKTVKAKQKIIGGLAQWIKVTHRLDMPMQPNTIRAALDEAQARMIITKKKK